MAFATMSRASALSSRSSAFVASPVAIRPVALAPVKVSPVAMVVEAKLKTRKAASKRFKVTGSGIVMGRHPGKQHLNEKMSRSKNLSLSKNFVISATRMNQVKKCLPNHSIGPNK